MSSKYNNQLIMDEIQKFEPEAHCTYFPGEEEYQVHVWGKPLTGFHKSHLAALEDCLKTLEETKQ